MKSDRSSARTLHQLLGSPVASPKGFHKSFHVNCSPQVILLRLKLGWFTFRCSTADWPLAHSMALSTVSNLLSRVLKSFSLDCFRFEKTNLVSVSVPLLPWLNPLSPYFHLRFFSIFPFQWTAQPPWTAAPPLPTSPPGPLILKGLLVLSALWLILLSQLTSPQCIHAKSGR